MLRKKLLPTPPVLFRERGTDMLRIEALSDAVFAFSVSLLVVSLEVPQTFGGLKRILLGAFPFFATVAMIFLFWYQQYRFFRCYGLNDLPVILLNLAYLALILFYVYPLKFLFSLLLAYWTGMNLFPDAVEKGLTIVKPGETGQLVILFSTGYALIWLLLWALHRRAFRMGKQLELSPYEWLYTHKEIRGAKWNMLTGLAATALALTGMVTLSGFCYLLIPFLLWLNQRIFQRKTAALAKEHTESGAGK